MMNSREVFTDDESLAIKLDPEIRWAYIAQHDEQLFAGQHVMSVTFCNWTPAAKVLELRINVYVTEES